MRTPATPTTYHFASKHAPLVGIPPATLTVTAATPIQEGRAGVQVEVTLPYIVLDRERLTHAAATYAAAALLRDMAHELTLIAVSLDDLPTPSTAPTDSPRPAC